MVIAIDGPAGVGKSTIAQYVAHKWNFIYLNTGRHYRAVAWLALDKGLLGPNQVPQMLPTEVVNELTSMVTKLTWQYSETGVFVDQRELAGELHSPIIDFWSSKISEAPRIRLLLNEWFRQLGSQRNLVAEGRDTTSVVFPNAEVRIFLDATPEIRAQRRAQERKNVQSFNDVLQAIKDRDLIDRSKPFGALILTPGCHLLDTSDLTIPEVCDKVNEIFHRSSIKF